MRIARSTVKFTAKILYVVRYRFTYNWNLDTDVRFIANLEDKVMTTFDPKR
jgi:hypothetical protein